MAKIGGIGGSNQIGFEELLRSYLDGSRAENEAEQDAGPEGSFDEKIGFNKAEYLKMNLAQSVSPLDSISETRLSQVNPELAGRIRSMASELKAQGIDIRVTSGFRSIDEQNALYAQGRTKPGQIVTNAKGGSSYHNYGLALDVVPLKNGQPDWKSPHWNKIGAIGKKYGLEWGGDFKTIVDKPHFQLSGGAARAKDWLATYNQGGLPAVWNAVNSKTPPISNTPAPPVIEIASLKEGSRGDRVTRLQKQLTKLDYWTAADGWFGPKTEASVKRFQREHGLKTDGIAGPKTIAAIERELRG